MNNLPPQPVDLVTLEISKLANQLTETDAFKNLDPSVQPLFFKNINFSDSDLRQNPNLRKGFLALLQDQTALNNYTGFLTKNNLGFDIVTSTILKTLYSKGKNNTDLIDAKSKLNRAESLAFLLDFAEAVMAGNDQVDNYTAYLSQPGLANALTFSEWQKNQLPSAPVATPQTTIAISQPPSTENQMTPEIKNQLANELAKLLMYAGGKGVSVKVFLDQVKTSHSGLSLNSSSLLDMIFDPSSPNPFAYNAVAKVGTPNDHIEIRKNDGSVDENKLNLLKLGVKTDSSQYLIK